MGVWEQRWRQIQKTNTHRAGSRDSKYKKHAERTPKDQGTDPATAGLALYTRTREATSKRLGHGPNPAPEAQPGSPWQVGRAWGSQPWPQTELTNLEIGVSSQGFVDQAVTPGVPWTQVHDVTLGLLICQGHGWELARSRRKKWKVAWATDSSHAHTPGKNKREVLQTPHSHTCPTTEATGHVWVTRVLMSTSMQMFKTRSHVAQAGPRLT